MVSWLTSHIPQQTRRLRANLKHIIYNSIKILWHHIFNVGGADCGYDNPAPVADRHGDAEVAQLPLFVVE
jgi:hypothetical protein